MRQMKHIDVLQAQATFSQILADVERGEVFVITRDGKPVAWLVPMSWAHPLSQQPTP